jgi:hypothetical protein
MDNDEFYYHMELIRDMLKFSDVRIILFHPPYTKTQQVIIDSISRNSKNIIGQLVRPTITKKNVETASKEIERLITSHHEPLISNDKLRFVIIGQQKVNKK